MEPRCKSKSIRQLQTGIDVLNVTQQECSTQIVIG
jgi:hypothetical protein